MTHPHTTDVETARQALAARYPKHLTDTHGRQHRCIPRDAILRGDWDRGDAIRALVRDAAEGRGHG